MNTNTTLERIAAANTVPSADALPADSWSADDLLARIDERNIPVTDLKTTEQPTATRPTSGWRGLAIAGAVAAAIILVAGVIALISTEPTSEPADQAPADAMAVVATFHERFDVASPDVAAVFSPAFFDAVPGAQAQIESTALYAEVTGMGLERNCVLASGGSVDCSVTVSSGIDPSQTYEMPPHTFTVEDGLILTWTSEGVWKTEISLDRQAAQAYAVWMRDNHPGDYADLILFGQTLQMHTEELRKRQRAMIALYHDHFGQ